MYKDDLIVYPCFNNSEISLIMMWSPPVWHTLARCSNQIASPNSVPMHTGTWVEYVWAQASDAVAIDSEELKVQSVEQCKLQYIPLDRVHIAHIPHAGLDSDYCM